MNRCIRRSFHWRILSIAAAMCALPWSGSRAQQGTEINIPETPCAGCSVTARRVATIGGPVSPLTGLPSAVVRLVSGDYVVVTGETAHPDSIIPVFGADGRFRRFLARRGTGPGEIGTPLAISEGADNTVVIHESARVHVFTSALRFVSTERLATGVVTGGVMARVTADGLSAFTRANVRDSVYLFRVGRASEKALASPLPEGSRARQLATKDGPGTASFWETVVFAADGYGATRLDTLGNRGALLRRRPTWWFEQSQPQRVAVMRGNGVSTPGDTIVRPGSSVMRAMEVRSGLLYTLSLHSSPDWRRVRTMDRHQGGLYRAVLEVLDMDPVRFVGRVEVQGRPIALLRDQVITYREDADGFPYLDVWQVEVRPSA